MNSSEIIHELLYHALIEIREEGRQEQNNVIFHLADLFHNVPKKLERAGKGERSYDDILREIKDRAKEQKIDSWIENVIKHLELKSQN